ncbi:MAG: hypothetical protein ACE5H5_01840 [Nitrospinota bacterium]
MTHRKAVRLLGGGLVLLVLVGCKAVGLGKAKADLQAMWNFKAAHSLVFPLQAKEREFSALVTDAESLYLVSERDGRVLRLAYPIGPESEFEEFDLWQREGAEYEAAALQGDRLYLIDEHADRSRNVFPLLVTVSLQNPAQRLAVSPLRWEGLDCDHGQCLEGLAFVGTRVYLLDERDHLPSGRCASRLYVTTLSALEAGGRAPPITIDLTLPDCDWRYTALHPVTIGPRAYLLALRTRCSWNEATQACEKDEYILELLNPAGAPVVTSSYRFPETTIRWWRMANVSRNLEGIVVGPDGALYLASDNRWVLDREPKSLLLRIPPR